MNQNAILHDIVCMHKNGMPQELIENEASKLDKTYQKIYKESLIFVDSDKLHAEDVTELLEDFLKKRLEYKVKNKKEPSYLIVTKEIYNRFQGILVYWTMTQREYISIGEIEIKERTFGLKVIILEDLLTV